MVCKVLKMSLLESVVLVWYQKSNYGDNNHFQIEWLSYGFNQWGVSFPKHSARQVAEQRRLNPQDVPVVFAQFNKFLKNSFVLLESLFAWIFVGLSDVLYILWDAIKFVFK